MEQQVTSVQGWSAILSEAGDNEQKFSDTPCLSVIAGLYHTGSATRCLQYIQPRGRANSHIIYI